VGVGASLLLDGRQASWPRWSVPGLLAERGNDIAVEPGGWQSLPGRLDRASRPLLVWLVITVVLLVVMEALVP